MSSYPNPLASDSLLPNAHFKGAVLNFPDGTVASGTPVAINGVPATASALTNLNLTATDNSSVLSILPIVAAGDWTPTISAASANLGTNLSVYGSYIRVGNIVMCAASLLWQVGTAITTETNIQFQLSLPVALTGSNWANGYLVQGTVGLGDSADTFSANQKIAGICTNLSAGNTIKVTAGAILPQANVPITVTCMYRLTSS